jgi:Tol biopolymer transport system component
MFSGLAVLLLALLFASRALASGSPEISYFAGHDGDFEIYLLDINRAMSTNLTHNAGEDTRPAWSPDGSQLAFYSHRSGRTDLYVMNADGSGVRRVVASGGPGAYPAWSWDGQWIAFASIQPVTGGIYRVHPDGTDLQRLTYSRASLVAWSPDSQRIAFTSDCDNNCDIFIMNADGSNVRQLTRSGVFDVYPVWSPDSRQIAFMSNRDSNLEVYVMDADCDETAQFEGCTAYRLTHNGGFDGFPDWSPDGRWIAFSTDRDGNFEIYALPADCYRLPDGCPPGRRLTTRDASDVGAVWSPDSSQLAFESASDAYVMDADGSHIRLVAHSIARGQALTWRP